MGKYSVLSKEEFLNNTNWKMTYEEYLKCHCGTCDRNCIHRGCFRRVPRIDGGLGLCPRLNEKEAVL